MKNTENTTLPGGREGGRESFLKPTQLYHDKLFFRWDDDDDADDDEVRFVLD